MATTVRLVSGSKGYEQLPELGLILTPRDGSGYQSLWVSSPRGSSSPPRDGRGYLKPLKSLSFGSLRPLTSLVGQEQARAFHVFFPDMGFKRYQKDLRIITEPGSGVPSL